MLGMVVQVLLLISLALVLFIQVEEEAELLVQQLEQEEQVAEEQVFPARVQQHLVRLIQVAVAVGFGSLIVVQVAPVL
jgi:hypothetical protein